jgi:hypothetical protein
MPSNSKQSVIFNLGIEAEVKPSVKSAGNIIEILQDKLKAINNNPTVINIATKGADKAIATANKFKASVGNAFKDLKGNISGLAADIPGVGPAIGALTNPIGAATAAAVAFGTAMYKTAEDIKQVDVEVQRFAKSNDDLKATTDIVRGISKTFDGIDPKALTDATNVLVNEFGIKGAEAAELVSKGLTATNGKLNLDDIKEFSSQIKGAGGNAESLIKTLSVSSENGLFSNKSVDAMKEFTTRIKQELPDATKIALGKAGINADKFQKEILNGSKTAEEAFKEVFSKVDKIDPKVAQELNSGLGGSAAEDLGQKGLLAISTNTKSLDEMAQKYDEVAKKGNINLEITKEQSKATRGIIPIMKMISEWGKKLELAFWKIATPIMEVVNKILPQLIDAFKTVWDIVSSVGEAINEIWSAIFGEGVFDSLKRVFGWLTSTLGFVWDLTKKIFGVIAKVVGFLLFNDTLNKLGDRLLEVTKNPIKVESDSNALGTAEGGVVDETSTSNKSVSSIAGAAMDNNVKSSQTGEVKNIIVNLGALQNIQNQNISNMGDQQTVKQQMLELLIGVSEDFSQYA